MQPRTLARLSHHVDPQRLAPHYLTARDEPWVAALLEEHAASVGCRRSELLERLREPLRVAAPAAKLQLVIEVLDALGRNRTTSSVPPKEARLRTFVAAASSSSRAHALAEAAAALGVTSSEVEAALFADLRGERRVSAMPEWLCPRSLILEANLALVVAFMRRAAAVRIAARDEARALIRHARRGGLICVPSLVPGTDVITLDVSGPFALFRHTSVYARSLASLVLRAARYDEFELAARCALGVGPGLSTLVVRSGDPISTRREVADFDTRLEARLARDLARITSGWELDATPQLFEQDGQLASPDLAMIRRRSPHRRCFLEIIGYWTNDYLSRKLERVQIDGSPLLLCVDVQRQCGEGELPPHPAILPYTKRLDASDVLRAVNRLLGLEHAE